MKCTTCLFKTSLPLYVLMLPSLLLRMSKWIIQIILKTSPVRRKWRQACEGQMCACIAGWAGLDTLTKSIVEVNLLSSFVLRHEFSTSQGRNHLCSHLSYTLDNFLFISQVIILEVTNTACSDKEFNSSCKDQEMQSWTINPSWWTEPCRSGRRQDRLHSKINLWLKRRL